MFQIDKRALNQKRMIQIILEIHFIMKSSYLMNLPFKNKPMNICMISIFKRKKEF